MYYSISVVNKSKVGGHVHLMILCGMLAEAAATGGRVSQRAAKRTHVFLHHQQERSRSFQSKWSLVNERVSLYRRGGIFFSHALFRLAGRGFWKLLTFESILSYFQFNFFLLIATLFKERCQRFKRISIISFQIFISNSNQFNIF